MSKSRPSLVRRTLKGFRNLWKGRRRRYDDDLRRSRRFEFLEARQMLHGGTDDDHPAAEAEPTTYDPNTNFHIHYQLDIVINGDQVVIPKAVGNNVGANSNRFHTHDFTGKIHVHPGPIGRFVTVNDFFESWRNDTVLGNPNAAFSSSNILGFQNNSTHTVRMYVNGVLNTEFQNYQMNDNDRIVISYEPITNGADRPTFDTIANKTGGDSLLGGTTLWVPLDGFDPQGGALSYEVSVANPSLVEASISPSANKTMRMDVIDFGVLSFQLFDHLVPNVTQHFKTLVGQGDFNNTASRPVEFYRIVPGFVIQGGPEYPTGTSSLGLLGDQFHVDLQHTSTGLLSLAKPPRDDEGDAQFFVTDTNDISLRRLDFNHPIFGVLTDGEEVRVALQNTRTSGDGPPQNPATVVIGTTTIVDDLENGALKLKALEGTSGSTSVTVTVRDAQGNSFSQTFQVQVTPDTFNTGPFLNHIDDVNATAGQPIILQLSAQDAENNTRVFSAEKPVGNTVDYQISTNSSTGQVTITPPAGFVGTFNVLAKVRQSTDAHANDQFDTELVQITVAPGVPVVDLAAASDSGASNSDNVTNATQLEFVISNVTSGAVVKLYEGNTVLTQGTVATGANTITLTVNSPGTLIGQGESDITATQTITGGQESERSTVVKVNYDTTQPADFTSVPPLNANVDFNVNYNAQTPDEGTAGFSYRLSGAPAGAQINATTGVLSWTPASNQTGSHNFSIIASDLAGNERTQLLGIAVAEADVDLSLTLTDTSGNPLTNLSIGQDFILHVFAEDLRDIPQGTFAAYLDINWDGALATVASTRLQIQQITFNSDTDETPGTLVEGSTFRLTGRNAAGTPFTTGVITYSTTQATTRANIQSALDASLGAGTVTVAALTAKVFNVTFNNTIGTRDIALMSAAQTSWESGDLERDPLEIGNFQGAIRYSPTYPNGASGDTSVSGQIDEAGSVGTGSVVGPGPKEVFFIPMRATASGTLTFSTSTADLTPGHDVLVLGADDPVPDANVHLGTVSIEVAGNFTAVNDTASVPEDSTNFVLNPLANDASIGGTTNQLTISAVSATSSGGTVTITQNDTRLSYSPAPNFVGTETFTYTARNQNGEMHTATMTVTVTGVNDLPSANNDTFSVPRNATNFVLNVLQNDSSAPDTGETLTVTARTTGSAGGTLTIGPNGGDIRYTPANNFIGTESFTYTISDGNGGTDTATVTLTVGGIGANADTFTVEEDSDNNVLHVLENDTTDPQTGGTLTITGFGQGANGTVALAQNGTRISYSPNDNFQGVDSFTYTISDGQGHSAVGTATVTVSNTNDPPVAVADSLTAFRNTEATLDVLANDTTGLDPTTEALFVNSVTQPPAEQGTVAITADGKKVTFTPAADFIGEATFTYTVRDAGGLVSSSATATVNVLEFVPSTLSGFVYFDVNNNGQKDPGELGIGGVTITLTGTPTPTGVPAINQTLKTASDGSYKFENLAPGTNFVIKQTPLAFTIDGRETAGSQGGTTSTNEEIRIANLAQATTGINNNFGERGRAVATISLRDLYSSNARSHVFAALNGTGGELWHTLGGEDWQGFSKGAFSSPTTSQLKVEATNPQSQQVTSTVSTSSDQVGLVGQTGANKLFRFYGTPTNFAFSNVTPNLAPTLDAISNPAAIAEDAPSQTINLTGISAGAGESSQSLTVTATSSNTALIPNPTVSYTSPGATGSLNYTPVANQSGSAVITVTVRDSGGTSGGGVDTVTRTFNVSVTPANDAPTGAPDSYNAIEDTPFTPTTGVLANDTDPDGDTPLTAVIGDQPASGSVSLNADGTFTYTPPDGFTGTVSFTYKAKDPSNAESASTTVTITVAPNQPPSAANDSYTTPLNFDKVEQEPGVLANDTDPNGNGTLTASTLTGPANGTVTLNSNGSFRYTPNNNFNGVDSFTYTASDGSLTSTATVTITVGTNNAPVAGDDTVTTPENTSVTVNVLTNDDDPDTNDTVTVTEVSDPPNGTATINGGTTITYVPDSNFDGTDSFTYTISDGRGGTDTATVTVTVTPAGGEGEGEALSDAEFAAHDAALMAYLASLEDDHDHSHDHDEPIDNWEGAVDEAMAALAA
jgi:VCBS repeat-containing protein